MKIQFVIRLRTIDSKNGKVVHDFQSNDFYEVGTDTMKAVKSNMFNKIEYAKKQIEKLEVD